MATNDYDEQISDVYLANYDAFATSGTTTTTSTAGGTTYAYTYPAGNTKFSGGVILQYEDSEIDVGEFVRETRQQLDRLSQQVEELADVVQKLLLLGDRV